MNVPRGRRLETPTATEELHIIRKLRVMPDFFCGAVTPAERGARLRKFLRERGLERVRITRDGDETWLDASYRWYGPDPISTEQPQPETVSP